MMIDDLLEISIEEMSEEELREFIRKLRLARRLPEKSRKKGRPRPKKSFHSLISELSPEQARQLIELIGED